MAELVQAVTGSDDAWRLNSRQQYGRAASKNGASNTIQYSIEVVQDGFQANNSKTLGNAKTF